LNSFIEAHGDLLSNRLSLPREIGKGFSGGTYLSKFIDIVYDVNFPYHPEKIYEDFISTGEDYDLEGLNSSFTLLAKLCEYSQILLELTIFEDANIRCDSTSERGIDTRLESEILTTMCHAFASIAEKCLRMFTRVPTSKYLLLFESSPVARSVAAFLCKLVSSPAELGIYSNILLSFEDEATVEVLVDQIAMIVACAHVDNSLASLYIATRVRSFSQSIHL
jgi:hypothetical protein